MTQVAKGAIVFLMTQTYATNIGTFATIPLTGYLAEVGRQYFESYKQRGNSSERRPFHKLAPWAQRTWCHGAQLAEVRQAIRAGRNLARMFRGDTRVHAACLTAIAAQRARLVEIKGANPLHWNGFGNAPVVPLPEACGCAPHVP